MAFHSHAHYQPSFYAASAIPNYHLQTIPTIATPDSEYDYSTVTSAGTMSTAPMQPPSSYALGPRHIQGQATPMSLSPVENVQIEFTDLSAPYPEDLNYKPRKLEVGRQPSTSMHMRRRAQNRASQRAFRERKEKHTQDLQRRLTEVEQQYEQLKHSYDIVHKVKCQLEEANRRCSCGGSVVTSPPGSMGESASAASASAASEGDDGLRQRSRSEAVSFDCEDEAEEESGDADEEVNSVYEVVDWGTGQRQSMKV